MNFPPPFYRWRPHPWHGLDVGVNPPEELNAYIEITPFDSVKYEVDKKTGYIKVDRPNRTSSQPPALYGFIPKTYCGRRVKTLSPKSKKGDGDPLDICVVSERPITKSDVILRVKVVGGFQMIDNGEADDKIIAVLINDNIWGNVNSIEDLPEALIERMKHYFLTYKISPDNQDIVTIERTYDKTHALEVVKASMMDYTEEYGD
ncbi:MAG: inorganic pyrophosphatase [Candidatus Cloacimonadota bacterium]|nr:MAG: inorganic pyrophosphatase [Candidatus Cloacimonadota bacterium]PIE78889.1 MAG: inorganic pyrophosphatase [Candidatus Delongbacteria bacterium]